MAPHSSTLAWKIPWTEEPGRLLSMGSRSGHDWATSLWLFTFMHWRRKWQPTPVFLPRESQEWGKPGGLPSMGSHRAGHDWSNLAAAVFVVDISHVAYIIFTYAPSMPTFLRIFITKDVEFCPMFFLHLLRWSWFLSSILLMWCITLIDLWMLNHIFASLE